MKKGNFFVFCLQVFSIFFFPLQADDERLISSLSKSCASFGFDLYSIDINTHKNYAIAPFCLYTALGLPLSAAREKTLEQMRKVLHLSLEENKIPLAFSLSKKALNIKNNFELSATHPLLFISESAFWGQMGMKFSSDFLHTASLYFNSDFKQLDFTNQPEFSRHEINRWVRDKTKGKIQELMSPGEITSGTKAVITSALYFKGLWKTPFEVTKTKVLPFFSDSETTLSVSMMQKTEEFAFFQDDNFSMIEMPFDAVKNQTPEVSLFILLPKDLEKLSFLEKELNLENFNRWKAAFKKTLIDLKLPKFQISSHLDLKSSLEKMGMVDAFNDRANFSGMLQENSLLLTHVIHDVLFKVEEFGAEAAAATGISMQLKAQLPEKTFPFNVNHPFIFILQEKGTGQLLLLGKVITPLVSD